MPIMTTLSKVPFFGRIVGFVTGRARLMLEYFLIGLLVASLGFGVNSWLANKELTGTVNKLSASVGSLSTSLDTQVEINRGQDEAITKLGHIREVDSKAIVALRTETSIISGRNDVIRAKMSQLERNNVAAKELLDTAIPSSISCVLDGTDCAPHSNTNKNRSTKTQ